MEQKPTNPKDHAATSKMPMWLLSPLAMIAWAAAQYAGLSKYGAWNWRVAGVRASIYISAILRHLIAYLSGEKYDPVDGTLHLANIMACCAILMEAEELGVMTDDRPPMFSHRKFLEEHEAIIKKLQAQYADKDPYHYTIKDRIGGEDGTQG